MDVDARGQGRLAIRQHVRRRRLVRDERSDLLWMRGHQGQRVHGAAAAGEEIHRTGVELRDQPVEVVRVLVGRRLGRVVGLLAAFDSARVVGDDRAVGEVPRQGRGIRRRPSVTR